jgi:Zn-dependent protease with chaperone function
MILSAFLLAWGVRSAVPSLRNLQVNPWAKYLFLFLFSPLIIATTSLAVICMGYQGKMLGIEASWLSYGLATILLIFGILYLLHQARLARRSYQQISLLPQAQILGQTARILPTPFPYTAQVGFWRSQLVISQGLLECLDKEHLEAVLAHEQAHADYQDTFWFFWLNWFKTITFWLPYTQELWQELLFLREIRADNQAKKSVDSLVLAESLLQVVQLAQKSNYQDINWEFAAPFHDAAPHSRLEERINIILNVDKQNLYISRYLWGIFLCSLVPLLTLPLHS